MPMVYWWAKVYAVPVTNGVEGLTGHGQLTAWLRRESTIQLAGRGTLAAATKPRFTYSAPARGAGVLIAAARLYSIRAAGSTSGSGVLTASAGIREMTAGRGALAGAAYARFAVTGTVIGAGVLSSPSVVSIPGGASGRGALTVTVSARLTGAATGHGALAGVGGPGAIGVLPGRGALTAGIGAKIPAAFSGHGDLLAAARMYAINRAAGLSGAGALAAAARIYSLTRAGTLAGAGVLSASAVKATVPTIKGTNTVSTNPTITLPSHDIGNIIVIFAFHQGATTAPGKPAAAGTVPAWAVLDNTAGANSCASGLFYFVATATNHTSGTWTNTDYMAAVVLSGQDATNPVGGHAESGGAAVGSATAPALTLANTDGTSAVLHFFGLNNTIAITWSAAPTGYTKNTTNGFICLDTKDLTTSDGAVTQANSAGTSHGYRGASIEIRAH